MSYATQADLETRLNVTFTANPDDFVTQALEHATAAIDAYCNRSFDENLNVIEYHDGKGKWGVLETNAHMHTKITLDERPVLAVDEVEDDGNVLVEGTDYEVYLNEGQIILHPNRYFKKKLKGVKVTYDWGYSTTPNAIRDVCIELVALKFFKQLQFAEFGVSRSVSIEGESMGSPEIPEIPPDLAKKLDPWVKWGF